VRGKRRVIVTPEVSRHRVFAWLSTQIVPDHKLQVIARDDDTTFGILLSKWHLAWSLGVGSWHGVGNDPRYTISSCFETFPFPEGLTPNIPAKRFRNDARATAIAEAAKRLDELRNAWLNPGDLVRIEREVAGGYPERILPKDTVTAATLRERTLTNLYNRRPSWLVSAHRELDAAVAAAYGWSADISEEEALGKLLELNLARAPADTPAASVSSVRKARRTRPEDARREPQFTLPIPGKRGQGMLPLAEPEQMPEETASVRRRASGRRRR
jgi:type II restriction/modification system DNA methylase subunit YeeA